MVIWPLLRPDIFKGCRSPGRGLLLFGPPVGTESKYYQGRYSLLYKFNVFHVSGNRKNNDRESNSWGG
jgi:SpoVK/Ycf46/Vps4 family AAA+-type ATPase